MASSAASATRALRDCGATLRWARDFLKRGFPSVHLALERASAVGTLDVPNRLHKALEVSLPACGPDAQALARSSPGRRTPTHAGP
eukprot:4530598-Prymnesium_polylepis.1